MAAVTYSQRKRQVARILQADRNHLDELTFNFTDNWRELERLFPAASPAFDIWPHWTDYYLRLLDKQLNPQLKTVTNDPAFILVAYQRKGGITVRTPIEWAGSMPVTYRPIQAIFAAEAERWVVLR